MSSFQKEIILLFRRRIWMRWTWFTWVGRRERARPAPSPKVCCVTSVIPRDFSVHRISCRWESAFVCGANRSASSCFAVIFGRFLNVWVSIVPRNLCRLTSNSSQWCLTTFSFMKRWESFGFFFRGSQPWFDWLIGWIDWIDWIDWLIDWSMDFFGRAVLEWLIPWSDWSVGWFIFLFMDASIDCLIVLRVDCLINSFNLICSYWRTSYNFLSEIKTII